VLVTFFSSHFASSKKLANLGGYLGLAGAARWWSYFD
tara:strand:+ start:178 stop:288 length:111 start_codon:yes stop_codon:yes gene_type:complete